MTQQTDPVQRVPGYRGDMWLVTGYEEARIVLADHKRFVKDYENTRPAGQRRQPASEPDLFSVLYHNMLDMDPPDHTRVRALVSKAFTAKRVQAMEPRIQAIADTLIDAFPKRGRIDLIDAYAFPLPIIVIAEVLGIPAADRDRFRVWSNAFVDGGAPGGDYVEHMTAFVRYIGEVVAARRAHPQDDLISALVHAEEAGEQLTEQELYSMVILLIVAGHETTVNLIGNGTLALLQHPDQLRHLQQNPDQTEAAIEEFLRYNGPVDHTTARYAAEDVTLAGHTIPRGAAVLISLVEANRDRRQFADPEALDITGDAPKHLGFGYGVHYCLGAPLARMEGRIAINTLLRRVPDLALAVPARSLRYRPSTVIHGLERLPVRYPSVR